MTKKSTTSRKPRAPKRKDPGSTAPSVTATPAPSPFTRDPRLPAIGTVVQRAYRGKVLDVTVRENGFEHEGATYRSLSQLARHGTGAKSINGFQWLGLAKSPKPEAKAPKGTPEQVASVARAREARAAKAAAKKAAKASS